MKILLKIYALALSASVVNAVDVNDSNDDYFEIIGGVSAHWYATVGSVNGFIADPNYSFNTKYWSNHGTQASLTFYSNWGDADNRNKHGSIHGSFFDNKYHFGLRDAYDKWSILCTTGSEIQFRIDGSTKMYIKGGGNVGIATSSPSQRLHVNGNLRLDSNYIYFGSDKRFIYVDNNYGYYLNSYNSDMIRLTFRDRENTTYGSLHGASDGNAFGLLDADGNWAVRVQKDQYVSLYVDNDQKLSIDDEGTLDVKGKGKFTGTVEVAAGGDLSMGSFTQRP